MNELAIIVNKIKQLETEIERLKRVEYAKGGGGGGVTDHGQLTGLSDDDHAQYLLISGNKSQHVNGPKSFGTFPLLPAANPTSLQEAAHLQYVDTKVSLTGAQTIAGQKGFSSVPTIPHLRVTAINHVTSKYYVDQAIAAVSNPTYNWSDWTPSRYTGWSSLPTGSYRYCVIGKTVLGVIDMTAGTSNATSASISLPPVSKRTGVTYGGTNAYAVNNGTILTVATRWEIGSALFNDTLNFYSNMGTGTWNASGTKRIRCSFMYETDQEIS